MSDDTGEGPAPIALPDGLWFAPEVSVEGISALEGVERVRSKRIPARLDYTYTAGEATSRSLAAMKEKRIIGEKCPEFGYVYTPPRGASANSGLPTTEQVELAHRAIVTSFCVVNISFIGQGVEVPYVNANLLIEGADTTTFGLIQEVDPSEIEMGMWVEPVWKPDEELTHSWENIKWWKPTGEPNAELDLYREHV